MGKLGKQTFKHFVESECDRRLFLDLGADDAQWISPLRALKPRAPSTIQQSQALKLGHEYEEEVYRALIVASPSEVKFDQSTSGRFVPVDLSAARLDILGKQLTQQNRLCLIEHTFKVPALWPERIFELAKAETPPLKEMSSEMRPDLLLLVQASELDENALRLNADGSLGKISEVMRESMIAIRIVDVKHTHDQQVGASHLIELLVYAHALAAYLEEHQLSDRFFVPDQGHGILPRLGNFSSWTGLSVSALDRFLVPLAWASTAHLYARIVERMRGLTGGRAIESVEVNIQANCGRCAFLEDCKYSLGMHSQDPGEWDVRLLPYTSRSIGQQLKSKGIHTVRDVVQKLPTMPASRTPEPLDAERPIVLLKSHALLQGQTLAASPDFTGGEQHLTIALPQYTHIEMVLDVETDPAYNIVFAAVIDVKMRCYGNMSWGPHFNAWWLFWKVVFDSNQGFQSLDWDTLLSGLSTEAIDYEVNWSKDSDSRLKELKHQGQVFLHALKSFAADPQAHVQIDPPGTTKPWGLSTYVEVGLSWNYVSGGTGSQDERTLAQQFVKRLYELLTICHVTETFARSFHFKEKINLKNNEPERTEWTQGPSFAGFYWSTEQLLHASELLERHVSALIQEDEFRSYFLGILHWIAPSESAVNHPLRHKKVYDLRMFAETTVGFPRIINYSWHELASDELSLVFSPKFWAPHFNYMDFAPWRIMVGDNNINTKMPALEEIRKQIRRKAKVIHQLLGKLRSTDDVKFTKGSQSPEKTASLRAPQLPPQMHALAKAWYTYTCLNATTAELAMDAFISTYPSYSIGKLAAGKVSSMVVHADQKTISFELCGLSTNIKMKVGDYVFLIPEEMRDRPGAQLEYGWRVCVKNMYWRRADETYEVMVMSSWPDHKLMLGEIENIANQAWYVFATASDSWSAKLRKLLHYKNFGNSWLGHRLSALFDLGSGEKVVAPASWTFNAPSVYEFAPQVLPTKPFDPEQSLISDIHPSPDSSQRSAIHFALSRAVSCLQGPPGTGKSQTIVALMDEFLHRRQGQACRILVTAFSYASLEVVCEKVVAAINSSKSAARVAQMRILFARSDSRDPSSVTNYANVDDLVIASKSLTLNGKTLPRARIKGQNRSQRLEDHVGESFILFANAHQLYHLGEESQAKTMEYELVKDGFGFDLMIVDEASQLPADYMLAPLALVKPHDLELECDVTNWPTSSMQGLQSLRVSQCPELDHLTHVVIVGDHQQLPPVQAIKPPEKLRRALGSVFTYYVEGHGIARQQLQINYRSLPEIVAFTRELDLYEDEIKSYFEDHPEQMKRIAAVKDTLKPLWCREIIDPSLIVGALVHQRAFDSAVSPLEARMVTDIVEAFFCHMNISSVEEERIFWQEHLGIVSPHNAHGRLLVRSIAERLTGHENRITHLSDAALMDALSATIYSVEKFQGSDRTFIIASMGISSVDQLAAEEEFIYDNNRFNVLTSRAKQKMLLVCSQNFLDHVPRNRTIMRNAAHIRRYALTYCSEHKEIFVANEVNVDECVKLRWYSQINGIAL